MYFSCKDWRSFWDDLADSSVEESWDRRDSSSVVRRANCSALGAEVLDSLRDVSWD